MGLGIVLFLRLGPTDAKGSLSFSFMYIIPSVIVEALTLDVSIVSSTLPTSLKLSSRLANSLFTLYWQVGQSGQDHAWLPSPQHPKPPEISKHSCRQLLFL